MARLGKEGVKLRNIHESYCRRMNKIFVRVWRWEDIRNGVMLAAENSNSCLVQEENGNRNGVQLMWNFHINQDGSK